MTTQRFFQGAMFTARILWGALTFSNVLFGVVTFVVPTPKHAVVDPTMEAIFAGLAVAVAVTSFVLPARLYASTLARVRVELQPAEPRPSGDGPAFRFAQPLQAARRAMGLASTRIILSLALSEAVSLLGVVLHMQGAPMGVSTGFIALGTVLSALRFPTAAALVGPFERAQSATFAASEGGSY